MRFVRRCVHRGRRGCFVDNNTGNEALRGRLRSGQVLGRIWTTRDYEVDIHFLFVSRDGDRGTGEWV